jgi:alpha-glucosidase (family GH31 glycosyl hydrolase)
MSAVIFVTLPTIITSPIPADLIHLDTGFVPKNLLFREIVNQGLAVRDGKGNLPPEDAVLDFSNPKTVTWYQAKLAALLKLGVGAIKVDFGEAAPFNGIYASGRCGFTSTISIRCATTRRPRT